MKLLAVAAVIAFAACGSKDKDQPSHPSIVLQQCSAVDLCDPPKECHPIDGVSLCVHVCALGGAVCRPDEFALVKAGSTPTCACVPQRPGGRSCSSDAECAWGPDETMATKAEHLCVSHGGASACEPLGVACRATSDCAGGYTCDASTRTCIKPTGWQHTWRRDADDDTRCTSESQLMANPGPGRGWRSDCAGFERAECDDWRMFTCAPDDTVMFGSVRRVGTVQVPGLTFTSEQGAIYTVAGVLVDHIGKFEGGNRLKVTGSIRPSGGDIPIFYVTGWWLESMPGGVVPLTGLLRVDGSQYWVDSRRITSTNASVNSRLPTLVGSKVWMVGKAEGDAYRIWQLGELYKPDAP